MLRSTALVADVDVWQSYIAPHIVNSDDTETIKKIYTKRKEGTDKGNQLELIRNYFKFIGIEMNESEIMGIPKDEYKSKINNLIASAAFKYMITKVGQC